MLVVGSIDGALEAWGHEKKGYGRRDGRTEGRSNVDTLLQKCVDGIYFYRGKKVKRVDIG